MAAAAAVAAAVVVPLSSSHSGAQPLAGSSVKPPAKAPTAPRAKPRSSASTPATVRVSAPMVTATFTAATDVTAAYVLGKAAQATQTRWRERAAGERLARRHLLAHAVAVRRLQLPRPGRDEQPLARQGRHAIGENTLTGPRSSDVLSACGGGANVGVYPIENEPDGVQIGGQIYSWPQFAALPTDPAKLWPIVEADANVGLGPDKGPDSRSTSRPSAARSPPIRLHRECRRRSIRCLRGSPALPSRAPTPTRSAGPGRP